MREPTIARNYAETLLELANRAKDLPGWGELLAQLATAVETDPKLRAFLQSPRIGARRKNEVILKAYDGQLPRNFVRFVQALVTHRRQMLIPVISRQYKDLVDEVEGRIHASVTVAREVTDDERAVVVKQLSRAIGKDVVPHFQVNPSILGGLIVRVGDTVMDGSVRRRLATLKMRMLGPSALNA